MPPLGESNLNYLGPNAGAPLSRPPRRKQRARSDRGLPDDETLGEFAQAFLRAQHEAYPALAAAGFIPRPTPDVIRSMVDDFKARHRGAPPSLEALQAAAKSGKLGAGYFRYSCDNSQVTSIEDQMVNCLRKAAGEDRFIPWAFVYADYSMTGLDSSRSGYTSLQNAMKDRKQSIDTLYIDDFTRASRDELEWWRLAQLTKRLNKRMIGASDGFDLDSPHWDIQVTVYGLLSRLFIKSTRQKVARGMSGAARRGTCLGKLSLGFTKRSKLDSSGRPVVGGDGLPIYERCIDPQTVESRRLLFKLLLEDNWTVQRIARHFNVMEVDGWNGWTPGAIRNLIWSPTAIGVFIWNQYRNEFNPETGKNERIKNPHSAWIVRYIPELAIVPIKPWCAARRKLAETNRKYGPRHANRSRNQIAPSTLFSGTLYCECCHEELKLIRSTDSYKQMGSIHGKNHALGCQLTGSKSTRQIEECLLGYLRDHLLTDEMVEELVEKANAALEEIASQPPIDLAPLHRNAAQLRKQIERLVRRSASTEDDGVAASFAVEIKRLRTQLTAIEPQIRAAETAERQRFERLDVAQAKQLLADLRNVLNQDVAIAGPAIRELTGPILIRQEPIAGLKARNRWIAKFSPQVGQLLKSVCPSDCGRYAASRMEQSEEVVEVTIEKTPRYERMAKEFRRSREAGLSVNAIASVHGLSRPEVEKALKFDQAGERPKLQKSKGKKSEPSTRKRKSLCKSNAIAEDVVRMREVDGLSFNEIAQQLQVTADLATRAYDSLRRESIAKLTNDGCRNYRGQAKRLPKSKFEAIRQLSIEGRSGAEIVKRTGCTKSTVYRELAKLRATDDSSDRPVNTP